MNLRPKQVISLAVIFTLFVVALLGNIFLTWHFLDSFYANVWYFISLGLLTAQPCLLSIWCAFGGQKPLLRILVSMGMLVCLFLVYVKTLENDGAPLEVTFMILGIVAAIVAIVQIPLWLFRIYTRQSILLPAETETVLGASQFGIKHLLIATTISAVLIPIAKAFFPTGGFEPPASVPSWFSLAMFLLFFITIGCVFTFLNLAIVFNSKRRWPFLVFLIVFLIAAPLGSVAVWEQSNFARRSLFSTAWSFNTLVNAFAFVWTLAFTIIGVLLCFYAIGYRVQKLSR